MDNVMIINFNVEHQSISRVDSFKPVENSKNYLVAKFSFSSDWDGTTKVVYLQYENRYYYLVKLSENDSCKIPEQVIKAKGFKLAVQGSLGEDASKVVITTEVIGVPVINTAYFGGDGLKVLEPEEWLKEI